MTRSVKNQTLWLMVATLLLVGLLSSAMASPAAAQSAVNDFRSQHFMLHTDMTADESKEMLEKLEYMLGLISFYWQRPPAGIIEMYVANDVNAFPTGAIPGEFHALISGGGGVTTATTLGAQGNVVYRAVVYSSVRAAQHEAVHAYCRQTFGPVGPVWYSEGMAEVGHYWRKNQKDVQVEQYVVDYLRSSEPKSLNGIVNNQEATGDSWENYSWRWALCHLLELNPNYTARFRPLGQSLLLDKGITFEQVYGDMANEVSFEYLFFLQHVGNGFRVDLCAWDWKKRFVPLVSNRSLTARVMAARGWQPSGAKVTAGTELEYAVTGSWSIGTNDAVAVSTVRPELRNTNQETVSTSELGEVQAILMVDYELTEPIDLERSGSFTVPVDGNLYLRIKDDWNHLGDNTGSASVKITPKS